MKISFSSYSDVGGRKKNEDSVILKEDAKTVLAVVADGLGGHGDGEIASRIAVNEIGRCVHGQNVTSSGIETAIQSAQEMILKEQEKMGNEMGTTVASLWMEEGIARASHVGDSRIYQFRNENIIYQSEDHSLAQLDVIMGRITEDEIRNHPRRNCLLRALGSGEELGIETAMIEVQPGDAFLLCSDGFWEMILETEMIEALKKAQNATAWLADMQKTVRQRIRETSDNNSAITLMIGRE